MTDSNIIDRVNALLKSDKPKIIAGRFKDVSELTEQQIRHFKNAEDMFFCLSNHAILSIYRLF